MEIIYGNPFKGSKLNQLKFFLENHDIKYDQSIEFTVNLMEDNEIIASGSRAGNVLKCIACLTKRKGEGFSTIVISELIKEAVRVGLTHLFIYTKPENEILFSGLGFYTIALTDDVLFMENKKDGICKYVNGIKKCSGNGKSITGIVGAVVVNCNPVTNGHLYLIRKAAEECDYLYVFHVSEDKSVIPATDRYKLLGQVIKELKNVILCSTGNYLISAATFPTYFLKENRNIPEINCNLDIEIFIHYFSKILGINRRYVGSEPNCKVTNAYNTQLKNVLPQYGIVVEEINRIKTRGVVVSASLVRRLWKEERYEELKELVPENVYTFLRERGYEDGQKR